MWKRIFQAGIVAAVLVILGLGPAFANCVPTIRQAEAAVAQAEQSAKAQGDQSSQTRVDQAKALVKEAWDLRNKEDHAAALVKAQEALRVLQQQKSSQAAPASRRVY